MRRKQIVLGICAVCMIIGQITDYYSYFWIDETVFQLRDVAAYTGYCLGLYFVYLMFKDLYDDLNSLFN